MQADIGELILLTVIGVASIRADVILTRIENVLEYFVPVKKYTPKFRAEDSNPCTCGHDLNCHYFRSKATHETMGCYNCKTCNGFVADLKEEDKK
jgi:hypothetical protein